MSNVAEFIAIRQQIELLAKQIAALVERKAVPQAKTKFDEARELLVKLTALADNAVQEVGKAGRTVCRRLCCAVLRGRGW